MLSLLLATTLAAQSLPEPPGRGISESLARERVGVIGALRYELAFVVPAERREPVQGRATLRFSLRAPHRIVLDFAQPRDRVRSVRVGGADVAFEFADGHLTIPAQATRAGENEIAIEFVAGDESLNRNDEFLYTLFVPARAQLAFPCFDQPDMKARYSLSLDVPDGWLAVANGAETKTDSSQGRTRVEFAQTQPLPTYLLAFTAGRFSVETASRNGRTLRMFHRETDAAKVTRNRDAIFDLHASALAWLEDYTRIPYPFGKFDVVLIPSFQFGGMEHAGAILYNAAGLLLDESATQNQLLDRASVIAHETAHMWFGDLVTMQWFNDVWMKEVFANFMAGKIVNPSFPDVNHALRFLVQNYPSAYDVDRTEGSNPIRQDLANLREAGSLYGAIIYQKAPIVMRQLERLVGEDAFRDGLREYLGAHRFANATWSDLIAVLDARTPEDLAAWSRAWVEERGRPTIRTRLETAGGRITRLALRQEDPLGRGLVWPERLTVLVGTRAGIRAFDTTTRDGESAIDDAIGLPAPEWVLPVGGGLGYGFFDLDDATFEYLQTSLHRIEDPVTRGAALVALWEGMLEGRAEPGRVLNVLIAALPRESDELLLERLLGYTRAAFWRFTGADERLAIAGRLESTLRSGLSRARSTSEKASWFNALKAVATTRTTVFWLERLWRGDERIGGLPFSESDLADLALDLAVRDVDAAAEILATQLAAFTNPDRRDRFAFVIPAVSADPAARAAFFDGLADVENRRREAWVLDAVRYLHHPLRASTSRQFVRPALALVHDIQRTGDIFFPKRWADATLGGYQSVQTAADVRAFIDELPEDYPPRLTWVLLSSADPLFRAAKLLN